jgi:hypothetical protein
MVAMHVKRAVRPSIVNVCTKPTTLIAASDQTVTS